ncbi:MAG: hypothetical protein GDA54_02485 [Alphaproteobacteria bacterium GM7ARS4]|nr:hypothetical protein [Alphaproteobacteria bacterium GM7ARS4]
MTRGKEHPDTHAIGKGAQGDGGGRTGKRGEGKRREEKRGDGGREIKTAQNRHAT